MNDLATLKGNFDRGSNKNKIPLIEEINQQGQEGQAFLQEFLASAFGEEPTIVLGKIYQTLYNNNGINKQFLLDKFPQGVVPLKSEKDIDYQTLQELLIKQDYQSADALTRVKLCELAGERAVQKKWIYFTEVEKFPSTDLETIDRLWYVYSEGKFSYSIQRKIWLSLGKDYPQLWLKLKWKKGNKWTKYPQEFIWDLNAPPGHLPLSNQLRGVREIDALFAHPVWSKNG